MVATLQVSEANISLIEPVVIPDLFSKYSELKPDFSFLGSVDDYSQYYIDLERSLGTRLKFQQPVITNLGGLLPLRRKSSLHSYWRYFRLSIETAISQGRSVKELFLLLPLTTSLPVKPITLCNKNFTAKVRVYLFPFGCCAVNMDVKVSNVSLTDFITLARNLKGASIMRLTDTGQSMNAGTFKKLSHDISTQIVTALFGGERTIYEFRPHTFLFIGDSSVMLSDSARPHVRAIAAAMMGKSFEDISSKSDSEVEAYFLAKPKIIRPGEILLFNPTGSFFYASPAWDVYVPQDEHGRVLTATEIQALKEEKLRKVRNCMRNNYQNCLNVLFAVNKFLAKCSPKKQAAVPNQRLESVRRAISLAFTPPDPSNVPSKIYFGHACDSIASVIGLDKSLKELELV